MRNHLKISLLKIVSLKKNRNELSIKLHDNDIDIIGLSGKRLHESIRDYEVLIEGYKINHNDQNESGGGVGIYVKDTLPVSKIKQKRQ